MSRTDTSTRLIHASGERLYQAFAQPGAMQRWLPPAGMRGEMLHFDFRAGGSYRMRLHYLDPQAAGKTSENTDDVEVHLTRLEPGRLIEQEVRFDSADPAYAGVMRMTWTFERAGTGTQVTIRADQVPDAIAQADHQAGLADSLRNLAAFTEDDE